jgi:aspartate racemase
VTMVDTAQALVRAGVDFIVIPCVTAHYYIDEIRKNTPLPIISIIDVIKNHIRSRFPDIHAAGILATAALIGTSLLQKNLSEISVQCIIPDTNNQAIVEQCITTAKVPVQGLEGLDSERRELTQKLTAVSRRLAVLGADIIISACTEIGLVLRDGDIDIPVVDSVQLLAEEAVRYALGK